MHTGWHALPADRGTRRGGHDRDERPRRQAGRRGSAGGRPRTGIGDGERAAPRAGRLLITVSRPEAHVIYHELRAEKTLPGQTFELMAQIVSQLNGKLTAVELVADEGGKPSARLRLERTDGRSTVPTGPARRWRWPST